MMNKNTRTDVHERIWEKETEKVDMKKKNKKRKK